MIKQLSFYISCALLVAVSFTACRRVSTQGKGAIKTDARTVQAFTAIQVDGAMNVNINVVAGAAPSVEIVAYENLQPLLKTEVTNGVLRIYSDETMHFDTDKDIIANITLPSLAGLTMNGAGDADIKGAVAGEKFALELAGATNVVIENVQLNNFEADLAGAGDLKINAGTINNASYSVAGMGDVSAYNVVSRNVSASISGAGDIEVNASETLDADVAGAGSVTYKGAPKVTANTAGVGTVEAAK